MGLSYTLDNTAEGMNGPCHVNGSKHVCGRGEKGKKGRKKSGKDLIYKKDGEKGSI